MNTTDNKVEKQTDKSGRNSEKTCGQMKKLERRELTDFEDRYKTPKKNRKHSSQDTKINQINHRQKNTRRIKGRLTNRQNFCQTTTKSRKTSKSRKLEQKMQHNDKNSTKLKNTSRTQTKLGDLINTTDNKEEKQSDKSGRQNQKNY